MAALSPERWNALSAHLESALTLDGEARELFLQSLTQSDPSLVQELRALLDEQRHLGDFLEGSASHPAFVGPYRIVRTLGEGGMGTVYLAEQLEPVKRTLAIKVIRWLGGRNVFARFESERQALALMEHPNIARLYDAGVTGQGHPYFAMEYVDGVPMTKYCDAHRLGIRERLRLFQQVCGAVQHAHQKGVIHRDIKPSNVLVMEQDGAPVPKIIDFGIAKALHTRLTDHTLQTEAGVRIGTPKYMSPEQEQGGDIDSTTDIYSLGVLLYELLIGVTPRDSGAVEPDVMRPLAKLRGLENASEIAAHRGVRIEGLNRLLKGDLEWVTLKALEPDRSRRYASASEFAADVGRYLQDDVVLARSPGFWLSLRKFVRRNRLAAAVAVTVLAGFIATGAAAVIAMRERALAQARANEMRQLTGRMIFELYDELDAVQGATKAREKLASMSAEYLGKLEAGGKVDPDLAFDLAVAFSRLSLARGGPGVSTGDSKSAMDYGRRVLEFGRIAESKLDMEARKLRQLARSYLLVSDVSREAGSKAEALESAQRFFAIVRRPAYPERNAGEALAHRLIGLAYDRFETPEKALEEMKKALELYRREPDRPERISSTSLNLARILARTGDLDGALPYFEESLKIAERLAAAAPGNLLYQREVLLERKWLADLLGAPDRLNLGRHKEAAEHYDEAIRIAEKLVAVDPTNEGAKLDLASSYGKLGSLIATTQPERALALMDRAAEMARATSFGNRSGVEMRLAYLHESVTPLVALGRLDQARRHTEQSRELRRSQPEGSGGDQELAVSRKEAEWMYKSGRAKDALQAALRVRDRIAKGNNLDSFQDGYQWILALEAVQLYARGSDQPLCREAANDASRYWERWLSRYPNSSIIRSKALGAKTRAQDTAFCSSSVSHP